MREIALASGTGRTTLYRHFPDRDALVFAIFDRLIGEAHALTARALSAGADADPVHVVADLGVELADLGDRYRFLQENRLSTRFADPDARAERRMPLRRYVAAAQQAARVRDDLDVDWLLEAFVALVTRAASRPQRGAPVPGDRLRRTIVSIFAVTSTPIETEHG